MRKLRREATVRRRRGIIEAAEAALAGRLELAPQPVTEPQVASPSGTSKEAVNGMLFVPVRPPVRRMLHGAA